MPSEILFVHDSIIFSAPTCKTLQRRFGLPFPLASVYAAGAPSFGITSVYSAAPKEDDSVKTQTAIAIWILLAGAALSEAQVNGIWMGVGPAPRAGVVKDAPFSADLLSTNDRTDSQPGLNTEFHGKVARNSQGSTYYAMEHMTPAPDSPRPLRITVTDPATLTITSLDPQKRAAFVSHVSASAMGTAPLLTPGTTADGRPSAATGAANAGTSSVNSKTEQLGNKTMDGLQVVGVRTTRTTQTGGPDGKTFVSTVETWTSPELQIVVMSETRTSNGDRHVTKLLNIVHTEPSAALFKVPDGYSVRDNTPVASNVH
jgi:hypothetical protein